MKKILALVLALSLAFALAACGGNANEETTTTPEIETTEAAAPAVESALAVLEAAWAAHPEEEKMYFMGGDMNNMVEGAPGKYDLADAEAVEATFALPQANIAMVDDAASIMHGMMANNFTCGAFHVTDAANTQTVADALKDALMNKQWMCGFPEKLIIVTVGSDYIVSAFGNAQTIETFKTNLVGAFDGNSTVVYEESLAF